MSTPPSPPGAGTLGLLAEVLANLARAPDIATLALTLSRSGKWLVPGERCTLLLLDDGGKHWRVLPGQTAARARSELSGPTDLALSRGLAVSLHAIHAEERALLATAGEAFLHDARSAMILPLQVEGEPFGTLNFSSRTPDAYRGQPPAAASLLQLSVAALVQNALQAVRLLELNNLKDRLIASVSHDYKNPLSSIIGFAELLEHYDYDRATQRELLALIKREGQRLNMLVRDVLDLSRLSLDGRVTREPLDFARLIQECVAAVAPHDIAGAAPAHCFEVALDDPLPTVLGDPQRVGQALANLVGNAAKYSPAGSSVVIRVRAAATERQVVVAVTDRGLGIAPEELSSLFQPFRRTRAALESGIEGSGLGLMICKEIAESHGGTVWAESAGPGLGSTFCLSLPVAAV